jgi:hypothetical protein
LQRLQSKLKYQAELQRQVRTIKTLRELETQDGGAQNLTEANRVTLGA